MKRKFWTLIEVARLCELYPHHAEAKVAAEFGRTCSAVRNMAQKLGLKKSEAFLASVRFPKGHATWNKGMKGLNLGGEKGWFKPNSQPQTSRPLGTYKLDKDGLLQKKVSTDKVRRNRWRGVHELVWIEANGPIPADHFVVFKSGMRTAVLEEITADKVECITRAENMARNTVHRLPKEIAQLCQLRGVLNRQINKRASA